MATHKISTISRTGATAEGSHRHYFHLLKVAEQGGVRPNWGLILGRIGQKARPMYSPPNYPQEQGLFEPQVKLVEVKERITFEPLRM